MTVNFRDWPFDVDWTPDSPTSHGDVTSVTAHSSISEVDLSVYLYEMRMKSRGEGIPDGVPNGVMIACESTWAGLEQLAEKYRIEQSYLLFFHAIELLVKCAPEDVARQMRAFGEGLWASKNPRLFRALAASDKNPQEWCESIRQTTFFKAFGEVAAVFSFSQSARLSSDYVSRTRNRIVHDGGDETSSGDALRCILLEVLPILDEILFNIYGINLANLVGLGVNRELIVGARYLNHHPKQRGQDTPEIALYPFKVALRHSHGEQRRNSPDYTSPDYLPKMWDANDEPSTEKLRFPILPYLRRPHLLGLTKDRRSPTCRICSKPCIVQFDPIIRENGGGRFANPLAVFCRHCGLFLHERYPDLVRIHFGRLDIDSLGDALWNEIESAVRKT